MAGKLDALHPCLYVDAVPSQTALDHFPSVITSPNSKIHKKTCTYRYTMKVQNKLSIKKSIKNQYRSSSH
jgi:hypothetical protein